MYLSVQGESPVEYGQPVFDGGIVHATLVERLSGQPLFIHEVLQDTEMKHH